jgi:hypothetical protein
MAVSHVREKFVQEERYACYIAQFLPSMVASPCKSDRGQDGSRIGACMRLQAQPEELLLTGHLEAVGCPASPLK